MYEHLDHDQEHQKKHPRSNTQDNIFHNFKQTLKVRETDEAKEKMENDIKEFKRLVQWYYDMDSEDNDTGKDMVYTIIRYQWKEVLIRVGMGTFTPEMFTDKQSDTVGFLYGPLSLYVVKANHHDDTDIDRNFLDEYVSFYSPIGWQVYITDKKHPIEYGKYNKIPSYDEARNALYNASIRKVFYDRTSQRNNVQEKMAKKIDQLREKTFEELKFRYETDLKFNQNNEEYLKLHAYVQNLSGGDIQMLYEILQKFNRHKGLFI